MNSRGNVLIEGVLIVFILTLSIVFNFELFRRMSYETLMQHAAFIRARDKVMGVSVARSHEKICKLMNSALDAVGDTICQEMELNERIGSTTVKNISENIIDGRVQKNFGEAESVTGIIGRVHLRYEQLMRFKWNNPYKDEREETKSHLEITKECPYPTSSY